MRKTIFISMLIISLIWAGNSSAGTLTPVAGQSAQYSLTGLSSPPAQNVTGFTVTAGDTEYREGFPYFWIRLDASKQNGDTYSILMLVDRWPGNREASASVRLKRYILREGNEPAKEYIHALTGEAFPPEVRGWNILFPEERGDDTAIMGDRVHYLGYDFIRSAASTGKTCEIPAAKIIALNPDISVGTGRTFRDTEGRRLTNNREYTYVDYSKTDMMELIGAGRNHFWVNPAQYEWIKDMPVFAIHPGRGDRYPELLYRSNVLGGHAYFDEPGHLGRKEMTTDMQPKEMAEMVSKYTRESDRTDRLHNTLASRTDLALGDLDLRHPIPAWETVIGSVWFGMRAGATGVIHEGRYVLHRHIPMWNANYGCRIPPYSDYIHRIWYAFMRGAARHFNADWGVAIYGSMEKRNAPEALATAYDMGARYFWFWTSDHYSHMPYPEQIDLSRYLKSYADAHPGRDMQSLLHAAKVAVALPEGYTMEYSGRIFNQNTHHMERKNEYGVTFRQVLHNAAVEIERLLRLGIDFDIVYDADGFTGKDYDEVIYIKPNATILIDKKGAVEIRKDPRTPPRPSLQALPEISATARLENGRVKLSAVPSGGCPPIGFVTGVDRETLLENQISVIWEYYKPDGTADALYGPDHEIEVKGTGEHRFRAITADAYAAVADVWKTIIVE